jgi:hypothetical protein
MIYLFILIKIYYQYIKELKLFLLLMASKFSLMFYRRRKRYLLENYSRLFKVLVWF